MKSYTTYKMFDLCHAFIRSRSTPTLLAIGLALSSPLNADDLEPANIMQAFRAQGENAFSAETISNFSRPFENVDTDSDGFLTTEEYIGNSSHFQGNIAGARGFMNVSDNDGDERVSRAEYIQNRIITDEAKEIYTKIDPSTDWPTISAFQWTMARTAFIESNYFSERALAEQLFKSMDADGDGWLRLPEYLAAYGPWARAGLPSALLDGIK